MLAIDGMLSPLRSRPYADGIDNVQFPAKNDAECFKSDLSELLSILGSLQRVSSDDDVIDIAHYCEGMNIISIVTLS
jgi:hypothetical protein